jgi:hypothetical protein
MQAELEKWIADHWWCIVHEDEECDCSTGFVSTDDLRALLAGKVLCDAEPVAYKDEQKRTVRISENGKGDGGFVGPDRAIPDAWVRLYAPASLAGNANIGKEGA